MTESDFITYCYNQHDVICNQKYDNQHPYSFHLKMVRKVAQQFQHLLLDSQDREWCRMGCAGHDLIEDARLTFNNIKELTGHEVAEIIYACTEEKGRDRETRHSKEYYLRLAENKLAVFVKLCDIIANIKYSLLTNSSMYQKYKKEHNKTWDYLFEEQYKEMFYYLDRLFEVEK